MTRQWVPKSTPPTTAPIATSTSAPIDKSTPTRTTAPVPITTSPSTGAGTTAPAKAPKPKDTRPLTERFGNETFGFTVTEPDSPSAVALVSVLSEFRRAAAVERNTKVQDIFSRPEFATPKGTKANSGTRSAAVMTEYPLALYQAGVVERLSKFDTFTSSFTLEPVSGSTTAFAIRAKNAPAPEPSPAPSPSPSPSPSPEPSASPSPSPELSPSPSPSPSPSAPSPVVGQLLLDKAAFQKQPAPAVGQRQTHHKHGRKTDDPGYVSDDNDVPTRRYAYVETSRQQFMEALAPAESGSPAPAMRGRYLRHRLAMKLDKPSDIPSAIKKIDAEDPGLAALYGRAPGPVNADVMANIHQFLGSGINQRGISLASTKKPFVYSNDGDSFRSSDGVRLTVDLSLVPTDVVLLNHYARGGVGSRLAASPSAFPARLLAKPDPGSTKRSEPRGYNYAASVVKNRELFLSELRAAWVVDVEDHLKKQYDKSAPSLAGPAKPGGKASDALAKDLGSDAYFAGLTAARTGKPKDDKAFTDKFAKDNYALGFASGAEEVAGAAQAAADLVRFWQGYDRVVTVGKKASVSPEAVGAKARTFNPGAPRSAWFALVSLRSIAVEDKKWAASMHDSFWLGWARAAAGVTIPPVPAPTVTSPAPTVTTPPAKTTVTTPPAKTTGGAPSRATPSPARTVITPPAKTTGGGPKTGGPRTGGRGGKWHG